MDIEFYFMNILRVWSIQDYIVWIFMFLMPMLVLSDIKYHWTESIRKKIKKIAKREDILFFIIIIITVVFILANDKYNHIDRFFAIVNYSDSRFQMLRNDVILFFYVTSFLLSLIFSFVCSYIAYKHRMGLVKWFFYGIFLNVFTLIYLLRIKRDAM